MPIAKIITVSLSPCWDLTCSVNGINWGEHKTIDAASNIPAGKALNVSRALAWLGTESIAAGLWGSDDKAQLLAAMRTHKKIDCKFTCVRGRTRQNVTLVDTAHARQMHLRAPSTLATKKTLALLKRDLKELITSQSICVFAGSMPGSELLAEVVSIIQLCRKKGAAVVLDTSGKPLVSIVKKSGLLLIKPNIEELRELVGSGFKDTPAGVAKAARPLLGCTEMILVSRGAKGAVLVTRDTVFSASARDSRPAFNTVACGDYLLAGFLNCYAKNAGLKESLCTALVTATAKAWSLDHLSFAAAKKQVSIMINQQ